MSTENYQPLLDWFNESVDKHNEHMKSASAKAQTAEASDPRFNFVLGETSAERRLLIGARAAIVSSGALSDEQLANFIEDQQS